MWNVLVFDSNGLLKDSRIYSPPNPTWAGVDWAGEIGALAVNDHWNTAIYNYTPEYAPTIPTIPEPTGDVSGLSTNQVNPNASDEYLGFTWDSNLESAINNAAYRVVFFHTGMSTSGLFATGVTVGGTAGTPRWFVYFDKNDKSSVQDIKPWNQSSGNRARVKRMTQIGADYIYFVGLYYGSDGFGRQNNSDHITYYRCFADNFTLPCCGPATARSDYLTVYQCVGDTSLSSGGTPYDDVAFVQATVSSDYVHIISCEAKDLSGDCIGGDNGATLTGWIVEDNDYYRTLFSDGAGNESGADGNYCRGEGFVDFKYVGSSTSSPKMLIQGNRVWKMRKTDQVLHNGAGTGAPVALSTTTQAKWKMDVRYNVFDDSTSQGITFIDSAHLGGGYHSIVGNIISNVRLSDVIWPSTDYTECYMNTIVDCYGADSVFNFARSTTPATVLSFDGMGNCLVDTLDANNFESEAQLDSNSYFQYAAFIGTGETYEKGSTGTNYTNSNRSSMNFGDFRYYRKKLTGPEIGTISGIVPTSATPSAFLTGAPGTGDATPIGSRSGRGVDDTVVSTWP